MMKQINPDNFVDVWYGALSADEVALPQTGLLSQEERTKAEQYNRPHLKQKYINTRAIVRTILSQYIALEPQNINIQQTAYGKPYLVDENLFFNLSHTDDQFVLAVSNVGEIGIDLEKERDRANLPALVRKCFADSEVLHWGALSESKQVEMFYSFWVRKEALVKAIGRGIALGLNRCLVDLDNQSRFAAIPGDQGSASDWSIREIRFNNKNYCALVTPAIEYKYKLIEYL